MEVIKPVCDRLGVRYLDYSALFDIEFKCKSKIETFKLFVHHGAGAANTTGGKTNRLKKMMVEVCDADLFLMGHCHERIDIQLVRLSQDKNYQLIERELTGAISGSYLATYREGGTSYGEMKMYAPVSLGSVAFTILPGKRWIGTERR